MNRVESLDGATFEQVRAAIAERRAADPRAWALMTTGERIADVSAALGLPADPLRPARVWRELVPARWEWRYR